MDPLESICEKSFKPETIIICSFLSKLVLQHASWKLDRKFQNEDYEAVKKKMGSLEVLKVTVKQHCNVWNEMLNYADVINWKFVFQGKGRNSGYSEQSISRAERGFTVMHSSHDKFHIAKRVPVNLQVTLPSRELPCFHDFYVSIFSLWCYAVVR
jgi:hypothetical protein